MIRVTGKYLCFCSRGKPAVIVFDKTYEVETEEVAEENAKVEVYKEHIGCRIRWLKMIVRKL